VMTLQIMIMRYEPIHGIAKQGDKAAMALMCRV
jgi:hypothetical protein